MCAVMAVAHSDERIRFWCRNIVFRAELCEENAASLVKNGIETQKLEPLEDHMVLKIEKKFGKILKKIEFFPSVTSFSRGVRT